MWTGHEIKIVKTDGQTNVKHDSYMTPTSLVQTEYNNHNGLVLPELCFHIKHTNSHRFVVTHCLL